MSKKCKYCKTTPRDWSENDIKCYKEYGNDNWTCETLLQIRNLQYTENEKISYHFYNDQNTLQIEVSDILNNGKWLWLTWYKHRGNTEQLWILSDRDDPRNPKIKELYKIIEYFS